MALPIRVGAVRRSAARCAQRLAHASTIAGIAAGRTPLNAAEYIVDTIDDLTADLRLLRRALHRPHR